MRFGVCAPPEQAVALAEAGFDYIELAVSSDLAPLEESRVWATRRAALEKLALQPEAFNMFVPAQLKIVGPDADVCALGNYVFTALERAAQVGGEVIVLGSGGARSIPDGYPEALAYKELTRFLHQCADASERFGVKVVVEPLGRECAFITSVSEGAELVRRVGRVGVRNLADTWHMDALAEPLSEISAHADVLGHVHTAGPDRKAPPEAHDFAPLFHELHRAGYDGRVSLEVSWDSFAKQAAGALSALRRGAAA